MSAKPDITSKARLIQLYTETQQATDIEIEERLASVEREREVTGWMLLECAYISGSSHVGERTLLPFGAGCTFLTPPSGPVSPRGLASDMAVVIAIAFNEEK